MNNIYKCIFFLFVSMISSLDGVNEGSFFPLLQKNCDISSPFNKKGLSSSYEKTVGYITKLTINGKEIEPDIKVNDPENSENSLFIPLLIQEIVWNGKPYDCIFLTGIISFNAKASILEAICSSKENPKIEMKFVIYEIDHDARKFFPFFQTGKDPITLTFSPSYQLDIRTESDRYNRSIDPSYFIFSVPLTPPIGFKDQFLNVAFRSNGESFSFPIRNVETDNNIEE